MNDTEIQYATKEDIAEIKKLVDKLVREPSLPDHYHTGVDLSRVNWSNIYQKKVHVHHTIVGTAAATATNYGVFFIAPFSCYVNKIWEVHMTAGSDAGAVTLTIERLQGAEALDAGDTLLASTINLKGTADTVVTPTLTETTTNRNLAVGDRLAMDDAGTLTAVANVTVVVELLITP